MILPVIKNFAKSLDNSGLCWTIFARNRDTAIPAEGNAARPRWCHTVLNPVLRQSRMTAYPGYTMKMKTPFPCWPIIVHDKKYEKKIVGLNMCLSCTVTDIFSVKYWCVLEIWAKGHWRSFESFGTVSYSHSNSITTTVISLAISTQYTNMADRQCNKCVGKTQTGHMGCTLRGGGYRHLPYILRKLCLCATFTSRVARLYLKPFRS